MLEAEIRWEISERNVSRGLRSAVPSINAGLRRAASRMVAPIGVALGNGIRSTSAYQSLLNDQSENALGVHLGQPSEVFQAWMESVIQTWVGSIRARIRPPRFASGEIRAGFTIEGVREDYSDVLGLAEAQYASNDHTIPWLRWLLLDAQNVSIANYDLRFGPSRRSRTGSAIMIPSRTFWTIPSPFNVAEENNFINEVTGSSNFLVEIRGIILNQLNRIRI